MVHNAFHHEHSHGRAFHGIEARNMLHAEKRDSHGDKIKLNEPETNKDRFIHKAHQPAEDNKNRFIHNLPQKQNAGNPGNVVETVYSQVYVTETPGAHGAEHTRAADGDNGKGAAETTDGGLSPAQQSYLNAKSQAQAPNTNEPSATPSASPKPSNIKGYPMRHNGDTTTASSAVPTTHAVGSPLQQGQSSSATPSIQANQVKGSPLTHGSDPTAVVGTPLNNQSDNVIGQKSEGMSGGAKAGLAFGIIILIALAGGLLFFCWRRRKAQQTKAAERLDEKRATQDSFFGGTTAAAARGPQRESVQSEKSFTSTRTAATAPRLSLRPVTQFLPNILGGGAAQAAPAGNSLDVPAMSEKPKSNPFADPAAAPANPFEDGAVVAGRTSPSHSQKGSWEGSEPATPKNASFGTAAAVPITAANGAAAGRPSNNVHRVQLDFKPSMEDELELRSGQLVRMLHEYDDGWALCIRLDRSQQGVCPRTCLSKLPVKPRPQGPPPNGAPGRPMGPPPPGMRRPASPQVNNANMMPRPLTPTGRERANTLGRNSPAPGSPSSRPRSQSMSGMGERPMTPNSMPARKPVPGMAL